MLRRCVWSRNIKNGCSIYIYDISSLKVKANLISYPRIINLVSELLTQATDWLNRPVCYWNLEFLNAVMNYILLLHPTKECNEDGKNTLLSTSKIIWWRNPDDHILHLHCHKTLEFIESDQKVSVHLMITIQWSGAQRLFITLYNVMSCQEFPTVFSDSAFSCVTPCYVARRYQSSGSTRTIVTVSLCGMLELPTGYTESQCRTSQSGLILLYLWLNTTQLVRAQAWAALSPEKQPRLRGG